MRLSQFWQLIDEEFGAAYGRVLVDDLVLTARGDVTGAAALRRGDDPREIWLAICEAVEVPQERWNGRPQIRHTGR